MNNNQKENSTAAIKTPKVGKRQAKQLVRAHESKRRQALALKRKQTEAAARRKEAKKWEGLGHSKRYKRASARDTNRRVTREVIEQLFDGILLNLEPRNREKSQCVQQRLLRRIVEKRLAQQNHKRIGHTDDLFARHIHLTCASKCLHAISNYQLCV